LFGCSAKLVEEALLAGDNLVTVSSGRSLQIARDKQAFNR
jgi:hypothetical protein